MNSWDSNNSRRIEENVMVEAQIEKEMITRKKKVAPSKKKDILPSARVASESTCRDSN